MYPDCKCVSCICKSIKKDIEENYIQNREQIIEKLYKYFGNSFNDGRKVSWQEKLRGIQQMIENGDDENDVLIELEMVEVSADFDRKRVLTEQQKKRGKVDGKFVKEKLGKREFRKVA